MAAPAREAAAASCRTWSRTRASSVWAWGAGATNLLHFPWPIDRIHVPCDTAARAAMVARVADSTLASHAGSSAAKGKSTPRELLTIAPRPSARKAAAVSAAEAPGPRSPAPGRPLPAASAAAGPSRRDRWRRPPHPRRRNRISPGFPGPTPGPPDRHADKPAGRRKSGPGTGPLPGCSSAPARTPRPGCGARFARMARRHRGRGRDSRSRHPLPRPRGRARPRPCRRTRHRRKPPPSRRCRCLAVEDREQALGASLAQQPLQGRQPGGATRLEKCTLWLHHRHQRGHDTQDAATKFLEGVRNRTQVVSAMAITDFARERFPPWIQPHAEWIPPFADGLGQSIGKVCHGPPGIDA